MLTIQYLGELGNGMMMYHTSGHPYQLLWLPAHMALWHWTSLSAIPLHLCQPLPWSVYKILAISVGCITTGVRNSGCSQLSCSSRVYRSSYQPSSLPFAITSVLSSGHLSLGHACTSVTMQRGKSDGGREHCCMAQVKAKGRAHHCAEWPPLLISSRKIT